MISKNYIGGTFDTKRLKRKKVDWDLLRKGICCGCQKEGIKTQIISQTQMFTCNKCKFEWGVSL